MRRDSRHKQIALQVSIALTAGMFSIVPVALGAPVGGSSATANISYSDVKNGNVVIGQDTNISSTTTNNVIDWHDFSVAKDEKVVFDGGSGSSIKNNYMNVVTGANTSNINGKIEGGNEVYLVNPNGVIFGKDASVDVGSLYVSTRGDAVVKNATTNAVDFNATKANLITAATSVNGAAMDVVNMGKISADKVVLEGENIRLLNSADITAANGVTLRADDGYIHVGNTGTVATGYTSEKMTSAGSVAPVENFTLVDNTNWSTTLGTGGAVSGNYMLAEEIDASAIANFNTVSSFTGKIDGNFYAVKNVNGNKGLFASTNNAELRNIGIKNSTFKSTAVIGALITNATDTELYNVFNENTKIQAGNNSGALVGTASGVKIESSYNTGNVYNNKGTSVMGAGFVGVFSSGTNTVTNSYSTGTTNNSAFATSNTSASVTYENVYGNGKKFHGNAAGTVVIKNSVSVGNNQYRLANSSGTEKDVLKSNIDLTVLSSVAQGGDYPSWSNSTITDTGGLSYSGTKLIRPAWRIYEGKAAPVLTAFQQGIKNVDYHYEYFDASNAIDTNAAKYNNGANKGQDMTPYTYGTTLDGLVYNGDTLKIVDSSGNAASSNSTTKAINDISTVFQTTPNGAEMIDKNHVFYNAAGQRDATYTPPATGNTTGTQNKLAFVWSDQKGYDLVGSNISIAPRQVILTNNLGTQTIVKEYDGSDDAVNLVPNLFKGNSATSTGILAVDSGSVNVGWAQNTTPTAIFVNQGGTTGNADVSANKQVLINGTIALTTPSGAAYTGSNYVIVDGNGNPASSVQLNTAVNAAIYQRQLQVSFNSTPITKTYDKDEFVKDSNGNLRSFGQSDFTLNTANVVSGDNVALTVATTNQATYVDKATGQVQKNVGTHDVAVGGVTLTGTAAKNYTLVDASGNPVYSEQGIVTGFKQQGNPIGLGGGTFYTTGDITLRSLGDTGYKWFKNAPGGTPKYETATKEYDGNSNYADPGTFYVSNAGSSSASATTGMVAGDNLDFQVTSAEFTNDSTNVNSTPVRDANITNTPQGVRYTVSVSGTAASNYTFDSQTAINNGTAVPLTNGGTAQVMGEGNITPRTIYVTAPQASTANKTYDGDAYVKDANGNTTFDLTSGYLIYADNISHRHLVSGDGSTIDITGLYQAGTNAAGYSYAGKDVNYDATNTVNPVLAKDIVYTAKVMQNNVPSTNYVFNISGSNQATFNGKGTIDPVQLGAITFNSVSKTYDGNAAVTNTQNTAAPQYTDDEIQMNKKLTGIISGESISDVFHVDSNGYLDSTGAGLLANGTFAANYGDQGANGFTLNPNVKRDPQNLKQILPRDVEYAGISSLMKNHNYVLAPATANSDKVYGQGTINPFVVTDKSWIKLDRNNTPITKVYDGTDTIANPMSYLNTTGNNKANATVTTPAGKVLPGLGSTVIGANYFSPHSNGNTAQDVIYTVDFVESGNYSIADGVNNPQQINLKNTQGYVDLTLSGGGLITQKHIIATTPKDPDVTKTYDATDVISKTGNALVDISNDILPIDRSRITNGTTAKYIANANGAAPDASTNNGDKTVEYTLALNGDTYRDYLLDNGNGGNTITGAGTINKRNLVISGNTNHYKKYDGKDTVTDMPASLSGFTFGDSQDTTVLGLDNFDISKLTGSYGSGNTDATFVADPNVGKNKDVQYSGFFTALGAKAKNYTVNGASYNSGSTGTAYGQGIIDPAAFAGKFIFKLNNGITQTYSGSDDVGQLESNTTAAAKDGFRRQWVDLTNSGVDIDNDGTIDITLGNGAYTYTINSAKYTTGADAGTNKPVTYSITLNPASLTNYTGVTTPQNLTDTITDGEIKAREVTVDLTALAKGGLSKYYDNTGAIYNNDNKAYSTDTATGTILTGNSIVEFDPVDTVNHTGLIKGTNASTGAYTNADAGLGKVVEYTADITGDKLSNYIFKD
ncbi:beta strand repeat-containing protein, partial [Selenomonas ruminantium]|uniref:beta strand repeat-containing protein n=1 Tax=Selenomonas ruminantium TaxID=971 RepID=UPI00047EEAE8